MKLAYIKTLRVPRYPLLCPKFSVMLTLYFNQRIEKEGFDIEMRANTSQNLDGKHKI